MTPKDIVNRLLEDYDPDLDDVSPESVSHSVYTTVAGIDEEWAQVAVNELVQSGELVVDGETRADTLKLEYNRGYVGYEIDANSRFKLFENLDRAREYAIDRTRSSLEEEPQHCMDFLQSYVDEDRLRNMLEEGELYNRMDRTRDPEERSVEMGRTIPHFCEEKDIVLPDGWESGDTVPDNIAREIESDFELYTEEQIKNDLEYPVDYVKEQFGASYLGELLKNHTGLIDFESAAENSVRNSGICDALGYSDEINLSNDAVCYKD